VARRRTLPAGGATLYLPAPTLSLRAHLRDPAPSCLVTITHSARSPLHSPAFLLAQRFSCMRTGVLQRRCLLHHLGADISTSCLLCAACLSCLHSSALFGTAAAFPAATRTRSAATRAKLWALRGVPLWKCRTCGFSAAYDVSCVAMVPLPVFTCYPCYALAAICLLRKTYLAGRSIRDVVPCSLVIIRLASFPRIAVCFSQY